MKQKNKYVDSFSIKRLLSNAFLILLIGFILVPDSSFGQRAPRKIVMPKNIDKTEIRLITVGLGPALYMRYGHTLLKVVSGDTGRSYIYNWGMFSFDDPMFAYNFFLGERKYWVGETSDRLVVKLYRDYEDRNVYEQKINLTNKQKVRMIELINQKIDPSNMFFQYEHFTSNCATKPRDILDQTLDGYLSESLKSEQLENVTYRGYVQRNIKMPPFIGFFLDIVMSSDLEHRLSKWDETFYPSKLSEHLTNLAAIDDRSGVVNGTSLLGPPKQLVKASSEHESSNFLFIVPFSAFFMVLLVGCFAYLIKLNKGIHSKALFKSVFAPTCLLWGGFSAITGLVMLLSWAVSTHYDMHHNVNLLVFFVIDVVYVALGVNILRSKDKGPRVGKLLSVVNRAHLVCLGIFILGYWLSCFDQNVSRVYHYLLPVQLLFCFAIACYERVWNKNYFNQANASK